MSFESSLIAIEKAVFWEDIPTRVIAHIIPKTQPEHIPLLVNLLTRYTKEVMDEDAGDMADERYRMTVTIGMIFDGLQFPYLEQLMPILSQALPYTQMFILERVCKSKYLPAYSTIQQVLMQSKNKRVRQKCAETLLELGF